MRYSAQKKWLYHFFREVENYLKLIFQHHGSYFSYILYQSIIKKMTRYSKKSFTPQRRSRSASDSLDHKCVLYLRQSHTRDNSDSIAVQEKECREYCREKRMRIKRIHRETNQRARLMMNKGKLSYIAERLKPGQNLLISSVDRLSRYTLGGLMYCRRLKEYGNNIISVNEGINFMDNPIKFRRLLMQAEEFSNQKSTEQLAICQALARRGHHLGPAEYGYMISKNIRNIRKKVKCQEEQEVISFILACMNSGDSYECISNKLNESRITNRGKTWSSINVGHVARGVKERMGELYRLVA